MRTRLSVMTIAFPKLFIRFVMHSPGPSWLSPAPSSASSVSHNEEVPCESTDKGSWRELMGELQKNTHRNILHKYFSRNVTHLFNESDLRKTLSRPVSFIL